MLPSSAAANDELGALAYARFYLDSLDWAYATNSSRPLRGLGARSCETCTSFIVALNSVNAKGYTLHGGRIAYEEFDLVERQVNDYGFEMKLNEQDIRVVRPGMRTAIVRQGNHIRLTLFIRRTSSGWIVRRIESP